MDSPEFDQFAVGQKDPADKAAQQVCEMVEASKGVVVWNSDPYGQKMVSVVEIAKRALLKKHAKVYQYNRLEIGDSVYGDRDPLELKPPTLRYRIPLLKSCLSLDPQQLGDQWTTQ